MTAELSEAARDVLLAFADDEHLMGQQHTEWIGVAPFLEEDLAFASIGQDELGHAAMLLGLIAGDDDQAIDELAFYRDPPEWRSCALVERVLPDWGDTLIRHWLYDAAEHLRWKLFENSTVPGLSEIAARAEQEERYHRRHGDALLDVLLATDEARRRLQISLESLLPEALGLFAGSPLEADAVAEGVLSAPFGSQLSRWQQAVDDRFGAQDWHSVSAPSMDRGVRSSGFNDVLSRLREVLDLDRSAVW